MQLLGFDPAQLAAIAAISLAAFVVRGVSGFGSAMVGIGGLSLFLPPLQVVPAFLVLELLTTAHLLPGVWRQVDWASLRWVITGCVLATPLGLTLLAGLDAGLMRLAIRWKGFDPAKGKIQRPPFQGAWHSLLAGLPDLRGCEEFERARATPQDRSDLGAKRSHSSGYGEHLQRRAGVFGGGERA